ncbi:hypothetical protein [Amycolatopsis sp. cmx-11-32]|uniref:hypothetical protein n=1 Tax=Amycolatopsis sp. cmx-11-32 TaxID=2785796 RepID=UPI0039E43151
MAPEPRLAAARSTEADDRTVWTPGAPDYGELFDVGLLEQQRPAAQGRREVGAVVNNTEPAPPDDRPTLDTR